MNKVVTPATVVFETKDPTTGVYVEQARYEVLPATITTPAVILTQDNYPGGQVTVLVPSKEVPVSMTAFDAHMAKGINDMDCKRCHAAPGKPCMTAAGDEANEPHAARVSLFWKIAADLKEN